ncbi:branched-chain amino acid ABC transporter permease [Bacillus thuringiensis serovar yunnanensis]|nr:branched-chain amino acid ABC transporter permease [Bacillus thuringiensis serovar yunnanensis]
MCKSTIRRRRSRKKLFRRILLLIFILFLLGIGILFGTSYGHQLRVELAETILITQHRDLAKYTFLSKEELDDLLYKIEHPTTRNSDDSRDEKLSPKQIQQRKNAPLNIKIETIDSPETARYHFVGKLITISNPFNVKLVTQKGTQGKERGEKISVMAKRNHALAAVNASGFPDETGTGGGAVGTGVIIENGKNINASVGEDSPMLVAGLTKYGKMITGNYSAQQLLNKKVVSAAGFLPQLIVDGEKLITSGDGGYGINPRTIMAQKRDGSIMFLIIDGRRPPHSIGASIKECQDILYDKGAINAMAMDGGASSVIYAMGEIINKPATVQKGARSLPNAWVVTANEGQHVKVTVDGKEETQGNIKKIIGS